MAKIHVLIGGSLNTMNAQWESSYDEMENTDTYGCNQGCDIPEKESKLMAVVLDV